MKSENFKKAHTIYARYEELLVKRNETNLDIDLCKQQLKDLGVILKATSRTTKPLYTTSPVPFKGVTVHEAPSSFTFLLKGKELNAIKIKQEGGPLTHYRVVPKDLRAFRLELGVGHYSMTLTDDTRYALIDIFQQGCEEKYSLMVTKFVL